MSPLNKESVLKSDTNTLVSHARALPHHPKFKPSESTDITFKSSDGILFCIHRRNLETHAEAFPGSDMSVDPVEEVNLMESCDVLAIVFDFMYPRKQPDIEKMEFEIVAQVAEAVEKYQVFSAMKVCEMRLERFIPTHAAEILAHGIKHDYPSLVNQALPYLSRQPLVKVLERLPPQYYLAFCQYHEAWNKVFKDTIQGITRRTQNSAIYILSVEKDLSQVLTRIFAWEAIDNVSELLKTLEKDAEPPQACTKCHYNRNSANDSIKQAAELCLQGIQEMESFAVF